MNDRTIEHCGYLFRDKSTKPYQSMEAPIVTLGWLKPYKFTKCFRRLYDQGTVKFLVF